MALLKSTSWMSAKFSWFRLPLSHDVTVGGGAAEELVGVVEVDDEDALVVVECDVVWDVEVEVGVGCGVELWVVDVVLGGGGASVVEGGGGEPPPNTQLP